MIITVAYTEYQLIQIQALVKEYFLKDVYLITFKKDRIPEWLIDNDLYNEILWLPEENIKRYRRISKSYLDEKYYLIKKFIGGKEADILIGAQDENTIFGIIKMLVKPDSYWNIEDGLANYYHRKNMFKTGIFLKKILFNLIYGYKLDLSYGHGKVKCDKSFRMFPKLSVDDGNHKSSVAFIKKYIIDNYQNNDELISKYDNYNGKKMLIITNSDNYDRSDKLSKNTLFKFHPSEKINTDIVHDYIQDYVPIELLVKILPDLKCVRFDSVSSSILNILCLYDDIDIIINFEFKSKKWSDFLNKLLRLYPQRIRVL